jgi:putative Flp pilus-assembly TadE/G-like protein
MTRARDGQRGAVIVIVALWLPLLALFTSFAIDAGHWWDYSRNLQNRADAAALAGGDQLAVCLGTPSATSIRAIGEVAQEYSGPPVNTPDGLANLPYSSLQMTTDGFPVGWTTPPYYNVPNLGAGSGANYHVLLNSSQYWPAVAQNGANGYGDMGSFCNAVDPTAVAGDPGACLASSPCAMVDARLTQASVPGFFNLLGFRPNITAHARVQLQVVSGSGIASPIGVGDDGQAGCVVAQVYDESNSRAGSNGVLAQWSLNQVGTSTTWTGSMPGNLTIPGTGPDLLALRAVIPADCSQPLAGGDVYDASHGIVFINTYKPLSPPVANPARGSVWLTGGSCTSGATNDPYFYYFTSGTCPVTVNAQVDFPNPGSGKTYGVSISMDGGAYVAMNPNEARHSRSGRKRASTRSRSAGTSPVVAERAPPRQPEAAVPANSTVATRYRRRSPRSPTARPSTTPGPSSRRESDVMRPRRARRSTERRPRERQAASTLSRARDPDLPRS